VEPTEHLVPHRARDILLGAPASGGPDRRMTAPVIARRGEVLPGFMLPDIDGSSVSLESYRGRTNLVVVFAGQRMDESPLAVLLEELVARREEFTLEAAQVLVAVTSRPAAVPQHGRWAFPVLVDDGGHIHRNVGATDAEGRPAPAVFVTDRFREICAAYLPGHGSALPGAKEILDWLVFINIQCPECGVPEWPT
jgi:peroxiredoxin